MNQDSRRKFLRMALELAVLPAVIPSVMSGRDRKGRLSSSGWFGERPGNGDPARIKALLAQKDPAIWVMTGDSITQGAEHTHGYRSYPEIFEERIRWELRRVRDIVINTGVSGNTTQNILDDFDWRIGQFKPAVVSLMIGTNDCAKKEITPDVFKRNLMALVSHIRALGAVPILQTPNTIIKAKAPERASLAIYVAVMQEVAKDQTIMLVDNWLYWQGMLTGHPEVLVFKDWLNDPLHPNGKGHQEIARLMFKELSIFDPVAATCGGPYYEGEH